MSVKLKLFRQKSRGQKEEVKARRAVIYTRVSTAEQVSGYSLGNQVEQCRRYCEQNGLEIVNEYQDRGESAKTIDRTHFQAMLEFCREKKNQIGKVVVYDMSRFSRNLQDGMVVK